jgi:hypothetical protein
MPNYKEERSESSPFQNSSNQQDRRAFRDDSSPPHIPHDQLVTHFQRFIAEQQEENRRHNFPTSPVHIIRSKLDYESGPAHTDPQTRSRAFNFWQPLLSAWDALAYDRYDPRSAEKTLATTRLTSAYEETRFPLREPAIQLTRYQAGIIDALTEAARIPHRKGQTAIAIPNDRTITGSWERRTQEVWFQMCVGKPRGR